MNTKSKVILGILGAAAAGVVIGMLVAPETGKDARKRIKKTAGEWAETMNNLWAKGKEAAEGMAGEAKDRAKGAKSTAEGKVKENFS